MFVKKKENNAVFGKKVLVFARILLENPSNGNKFGQRRIFFKTNYSAMALSRF